MRLEVKNLVKQYKKRIVVDKVTLTVNTGEIVGLLGPNGAGKTTTFYMIVGLIHPNEGEVMLDGNSIQQLTMDQRARLGIGYLTQEDSIFRKLTVEENIQAILECTTLSPEEQASKLEALLEEFNLGQVRERLGSELSGGERRRAEIARCLALEPQFILLDEPFAGVDPIAVEGIQKIVQYLKERGIGILITDHNARETLHIVDRAYILNNGQVLVEGDRDMVANSPIAKKFYLTEGFEL